VTAPATKPAFNFMGWVQSALTLIALAFYYLPWLTHKTAALSANALDLAEWVGLAPGQRQSQPAMPASLALRMVLLCLAILLALRGRDLRSWLLWGLAALLALTLLPPLEFFQAGGFSDLNYRQFAGLFAGAGLAIALIFLLRKRQWPWRVAETAIAGLMLVSAVIGQVLALNVIASLGIPNLVGVGFFGFVIVAVGVVAAGLAPR
jgi:hypothetical protein